MSRPIIAGQAGADHDPAARVARRLGVTDLVLEPAPGAQRPGLWRARARTGGALLAFVKVPAPGSGTDLTVEARMLADLAAAGLPVPGVLSAEHDLLLTQWIAHDAGPPRPVHERAAARALADLHSRPAEGFGYGYDTPIGGLMQPNAWSEGWVAFYRDRRLRHFSGLARRRGLLPAALDRRVEALAAGLDGHIGEPAQPSLIHGDVWYGNVLVRGRGIAGFVDPSIHHADAEAELAYVLLHGTFGRAFFEAYSEIRRIAPGFLAERAPVYLVAPLLVHVLLSGPVYLHSLDRMLRRIGR